MKNIIDLIAVILTGFVAFLVFDIVKNYTREKITEKKEKPELIKIELENIAKELELGILKEVETKTFKGYLIYRYIKNMSTNFSEEEIKELVKIKSLFDNNSYYKSEDREIKIKKYQLEVIENLELILEIINKSIREKHITKQNIPESIERKTKIYMSKTEEQKKKEEDQIIYLQDKAYKDFIGKLEGFDINIIFYLFEEIISFNLKLETFKDKEKLNNFVLEIQKEFAVRGQVIEKDKLLESILRIRNLGILDENYLELKEGIY